MLLTTSDVIYAVQLSSNLAQDHEVEQKITQNIS